MKKLLALTAIAAAVAGAHAQDFPGSKPITIVVPFSAGGPTDRVARDGSGNRREGEQFLHDLSP